MTGKRKSDLVAEIAHAIGVPPPPMSTGSSEPRVILEQVNEVLGLGLPEKLTKPRLARAIVEASGHAWSADCESGGDRITLEGLTAVSRSVAFFLRRN